MNDGRAIGYRNHVDHLVHQCGITVDRFMYWSVQGNDLSHASNVMPKSVYKGRILLK